MYKCAMCSKMFQKIDIFKVFIKCKHLSTDETQVWGSLVCIDCRNKMARLCNGEEEVK